MTLPAADPTHPTQTTPSAPRLVRACRGEALDRPPVWLMRQAGRYMAEYRAVRERVSFLELCQTPELAAEVSLQPWKAFGMDAVIMFCDILIPCQAMGLPLEFHEPGGPHFPEPLNGPADLARLHVPDPHESMGYVMTLLKTLRAELAASPETALIGFAGAPWTLASYMVEGGTSKHHKRIKTWAYQDPESLHRLLGMLTHTVTAYLNAQIDAGAQVVQLFDTWAGSLSPELYRTFALPYQQQVFAGLKTDQAPAMLYVQGSAPVLPEMVASGAQGLSIDWMTPLAAARQALRPVMALQGNLDPVSLFAGPEVVRRLTRQMLSEAPETGYIANLGHGILPKTPVESVRAFVETVQGR